MNLTHSLLNDRLVVSLFLALVAHAAFIFGISFQVPKGEITNNSLDVTISVRSDQNVEDADFLAQSDQLGSGTVDEKTTPKTRQIADIEAQQSKQVAEQQISENRSVSAETLTITSRHSQWAVSEVNEAEQPNDDLQGQDQELVMPEDVESLRAMLRQEVENYASRPKVRTLSAASTKTAVEAAYLTNWLTTVESVGNANYPEQARIKRLSGHVRLLVAVNSNGTVARMEIRNSSGQPFLDESAKRIVRLSEPFPPFDPSLAAQYDVIEIVRTWKFEVDKLAYEN